MDPASIVAIIAVSLTGASGIIQTLFHNMAMSRCIKLKCCGMECTRDVLDKDELELMTKNPNDE